MRTSCAIFVVTMMAAWPALAQTNRLVHNIPTNATSPLPAGSCFYVDQGPGTDTKLCSGWAPAIGAWSSGLDTQSVEGIFALPSADAFKIVYRTNRVGQADTIASPTVSGFGVGFGAMYFSVAQGNSINPQNGAMLNGRFGYTFGANQGAIMFSDGVDHRAFISLPTASSQDSTQVLRNDNQYSQIGPAQLAPGAVTTPALGPGLNLTSPSFTLGSDAPGDIPVRGANGQLVRLGVGAANTVLAVTAGACTTDSNNVTTCAPNMPAYQNTLSPAVLPIATNNQNGVGRPDGQSLTADAGGTWHSAAGLDTVTRSITALGSSQADCQALMSRQNYVGTVAPGSGVCLPPIVKEGDHAFVCNKTTTPLLDYAAADGTVINTPSGPLLATQAVSIGRGCAEFIAESTTTWWVTGAGVPLIVQ